MNAPDSRVIKQGTLVFIIRDKSVLLAIKNRGFGSEKWNGFGGKIESNECESEAAVRETIEEIGVIPILDKPLGVITFHFSTGDSLKVTVFRTEQFSGEPCESEEMKTPRWFNFEAVPYNQMWSGDDLWLPYVLQNQSFTAEMWFDSNWRNIRHEIKLI